MNASIMVPGNLTDVKGQCGQDRSNLNVTWNADNRFLALEFELDETKKDYFLARMNIILKLNETEFLNASK